MTISAHLGAWVAPHPSELPDLRIQMCEQVLQPPHSREFMMRVVGGSSPLIPTISGPPEETAGIDIMGGMLMARSEQRRLRQAQLYWVDEDMTSLALAAAATPSHEPVRARRMPAEAGLMLFAHPIGSHDVDLAAALTSPWTTAAPDLDEELRLTFPVVGVSWSRWSPADLDLDGAPGRIRWTPRTPQGAAPLTPEFDGVWLTFWTTGSKGWDSLPLDRPLAIDNHSGGTLTAVDLVARETLAGFARLQTYDELVLRFDQPLPRPDPDNGSQWAHVVYTAWQLMGQTGNAQLTERKPCPVHVTASNATGEPTSSGPAPCSWFECTPATGPRRKPAPRTRQPRTVAARRNGPAAGRSAPTGATPASTPAPTPTADANTRSESCPPTSKGLPTSPWSRRTGCTSGTHRLHRNRDVPRPPEPSNVCPLQVSESMMRKPFPYSLDDDTAAETYVREALRRSQRGNWPALLADDRAVQTYRVLRRIESGAVQTRVHHREAIKQAEADRDADLISAAQYAEKYREYGQWRERSVVFDAVLRQYLDMAVDQVRAIRRDAVAESLRQVLLTLAVAVEEHRDAHSGEESLADTALWARLRLLPWPTATGAERRVLADAVATERARRGPARRASEDPIQFEGLPVFGETVDVVDLLLDVTDHTRPTCNRTELAELWKQRTPDLLDSAAAQVTAARQKGSYPTHRLRRALLFLEGLDLISRVSDEGGAEVVVTDRTRLVELRRRWDEQQFGLDDLAP
ncbi:hypothetical protein BBK82_08025 [Lentzea guizhouensis]|uniref:Uncharacterized protein n=1 Tax=Lentzea guizhouensis TaxID=1586287 RepID=A0A1B2HE66_9PSEU|nr:hypothetical protein BBK82_08025 [Lentzea guizhouensis]